MGVALAGLTQAAMIAQYTFDGGSAADTGGSMYGNMSNFTNHGAHALIESAGYTSVDDQYQPYSSDPGNVGQTNYYSFVLTVQNLGIGETLNLTSMGGDYALVGKQSNSRGYYFMGMYSDAVGAGDYSGGTDERIGVVNERTRVDYAQAFDFDLTADNSVADDVFTGLINGEQVEFRFYLGNQITDGAEHRLDNIVLNGTVIPEPATLGLVAAFGGAVLFIRRRFMM